MYHGTVYLNKQLRQLLKQSIGEDLSKFVLSEIRGKPARTKNQVKIKGNKVTVFGSDFIAKGYLI